MKIGVIVAMSVEFRQLEKLMEEPRKESASGLEFTIGKIGENEVVLQQCGIGKVNAAMGVTLMIEHYRPECVVSTGCAGGIDERLSVMDVVVSQYVAYHDVDCGEGLGCSLGQIQGLPARFEGNSRLLETALAVEGNASIHAGLILTGDQFITRRETLNVIKRQFPDGMAVDMESAAIAQVCYLQNIPFISFRVISDTPGAEGHQQQYDDFWGAMADRSFGITRDFLTKVSK